MRLHLAPLLLTLATSAYAGEISLQPKEAAPPITSDAWKFQLELPGWIPWLQGTTGIAGASTNLNLSPSQIISHINGVADVRAEAHKGKWGVKAEYFYLSLRSAAYPYDIVHKATGRFSQSFGDFGLTFRLFESDKGCLDLVAGVRYNSLYQSVSLQGDTEKIDQLSNSLAKLSVANEALARARLLHQLRVLDGQNPSIPVAPLQGLTPARLAAVVANARGTVANRQASIAHSLDRSLNSTKALTENFCDPYIGVCGRYNVSGPFYLRGKADIGGFTIGADVDCTVEAALGINVTRNLYSEVGYRGWYMNFRDGRFFSNTYTQGILLSLGAQF